MPDPRWENPQHVPLSNGSMKIVTPPATISFRLRNDGKLTEFLLPYPTHIIDDRLWGTLECELGGFPVSIEKPVPIVEPYEPKGRIGNESPDALASIIRVGCKRKPGAYDCPKPGQVWGLVEAMLGWIRVKARHYWLLHGHSGLGALYRGSALSQEGKQIAQQNFASYGRMLIVRPLDESLWLSIRNELSSGREIPVSDSIFCDALFSAVTGDEMKALLELGVAAEIEITQLLVKASQTSPTTPKKRAFVANRGDWNRFSKKLGDWPQELGLQEAAMFKPPGIFKDWVNVIRELYDLRNSIAHSGKLRAGATAQNVSAYIFATNALFAYCREQRARAGISDYSYPVTAAPYGQIVAFKEGEMYGETRAVVTIIS
jgi:hypothetical protein